VSELRIDREGAVAIVTLDRPAKRNALSDSLRAELACAVRAVADDASVRAVILTGAGGSFCSGGDLEELAALSAENDLALLTRRRLAAMHRWILELAEMEKPVIAAVDGAAYGAGLSLALAADFIVASPRARFCAPFAKIGLVPDAGAMYLLPRRVGLARAKQLVFTARVVDAEEALRIGLADEQAEDVVAAAKCAAATFIGHPACGIAKRLMNRAFESSFEEALQGESFAQAVCRSTLQRPA
jgi:2-(1,2-epoxy-1,2-dihydrophenyl)acetyl-CoA isomerase